MDLCQVVDELGKFSVFIPIGLYIAFLLISGFSKVKKSSLRRLGLFLLLSLMLCNFVVNAGMKRVVDRPRPRDVVEFGGEEAFRPVLLPGFGGDGNSFPSSHAAAGFSLLVLYFGLKRSSPRAATACGMLGLFLGCSLGVNRMIQGAHFLSDVLWAFGAMYFSAYLIYRVWFIREEEMSSPSMETVGSKAEQIPKSPAA